MTMRDRIKEAIEGSAKTKAQIARECDVSSGAVSQWISGDVKGLKAETIVALEEATGYRAGWILHGKGPKKASEPSLYWPFVKVDIARFAALDPDDQGYIQRRLLQAIEECERNGPPKETAVPPVATPLVTKSPEKRSKRA